MQKELVSFSFKAPYYKLGECNEHTKNIWIIFHGYGQLVKDFYEKFSAIDHQKNLLIFPQALSKFYLKGVDKNIGASWMTSQERELDIDNYITYLDQIYLQESLGTNNRIKLNILGFSQGGHTASRWIYRSGLAYDRLILWGSGLAQEINRHIVQSSFNKGQQYFVVGDQDRFIDQSALDAAQKRYASIGFKYELVQYQGIHDIYSEVLKDLL